MSKPKVGMPIQYIKDDGDTILAAQVIEVHDDGRICVIAYCRETRSWVEFHNVAAFADSDGDTNEPYWLCASDPDPE